MEAKVWLGGEGTSELGSREPGTEKPGAIEALLRRIEPVGWRVEGATQWQHIRKYRARAGIEVGENHGDIRNVMGLVLQALDNACELVAFTRDVDADEERGEAVRLGIEKAQSAYPHVAIIGGVAKPALEGWVLALCGEPRTDDMSRAKTLQRLLEREIETKSPGAYVAVVEQAELDTLPAGCDSLREWLALARRELGAAVHGTRA